MQAELVASRSLYMEGFLGQAALHLLNAWYALACLEAAEKGEQPPDIATFRPDPATLPNSGRLTQSSHWWEESLTALLEFSPALDPEVLIQRQVAVMDAPPSSRRRLNALLRFQLRAGEEAYQILFWQQTRARLRHTLGQRKGLVAAAALVLVALVGVGVVLVFGDAEHQETRGPMVAAASVPVAPIIADRVKLSELSELVPAGTPFNAASTHRFRDVLLIDLGGVNRSPGWEVTLDNNDSYLIEFFKAEKMVSSAEVGPSPLKDGLRLEKIKVSEGAVKTGYDLVRISFVNGDIFHVIGHFVPAR